MAALGVVEMVDENMSNAARVHAIESGKTYEGRTLIAFGGGGPVHACRVAEKVGIQRVLVPSGAGVGSAIGFLRAPVGYEVVRSLYQRYTRRRNLHAAMSIAVYMVCAFERLGSAEEAERLLLSILRPARAAGAWPLSQSPHRTSTTIRSRPTRVSRRAHRRRASRCCRSSRDARRDPRSVSIPATRSRVAAHPD